MSRSIANSVTDRVSQSPACRPAAARAEQGGPWNGGDLQQRDATDGEMAGAADTIAATDAGGSPARGGLRGVRRLRQQVGADRVSRQLAAK